LNRQATRNSKKIYNKKHNLRHTNPN